MSVKRTRTWTYLTFYCSRQPYWTASTHSRHWTPWKHSSVNVIAHSQLLKWPALFISYQCNKHITLIKQQIISLTKHATIHWPFCAAPLKVYIFIEKPIIDTSRYLSKQNACGKVNCKFSFFIQVQTVRKQQKKFCKSILTCWVG